MKFKFEKKYFKWGLTAFIVIMLSVIFTYAIFNGGIILGNIKRLIKICMPIIDGLILTYLLSPVVNMIERRWLIPIYQHFDETIDKKKKSRMRVFSIIITLLFLFLLIYGFIMVVIPQLYRSVQSIVVSFPTYINNLVIYVEKLLENNPDIETTVTQYVEKYSQEMTSWVNAKVLPSMNEIIKTLSQSVIGFIKSITNLIIGLIISIYLLASKEKFTGESKKILYSLFDKEKANNFLSDFRFIDRTFGGFLSGKLLDSLLIGILCFIGLAIIGTPYPILISVIVGVTNIIPFFGPYLGAIPSAILILMISPIDCLYFLIFVVFLQQFDGNFLGPKILGNSTGLSGFWVIFSITLFGGLFGVYGMLLGVPTFAIIYAAIRRKIKSKLIAKGYPIETDPYINLKKINKDDDFISFPKKTSPSPIQNLQELNPEAIKEKVKTITTQNKFLIGLYHIGTWFRDLFNKIRHRNNVMLDDDNADEESENTETFD